MRPISAINSVSLKLFGLLLLLFFWARLLILTPTEEGFLDWYSINLQLEVARSGLRQLQIPSEVFSLGSFDYSAYFGQSFWSFPYLIRTPDIFLLLLVSNKVFIIFHTLLFLSLAYFGFIKFIRLFLDSSLIAVGAAITYFCSGIFVGRILAGHLQLIGYFFIPTFILILLSTSKDHMYIQKKQSWIHLSLLLAMIAYLGSLQTLFQMVLFMLLLSCWRNFRVFVFRSLASMFILILPIIYAGSSSTSYKLEGTTRTVFDGFGWRFLEYDAFRNSYAQIEYSPSFITIVNFILKHSFEVISHLFLSSFDLNMAIKVGGGWEWDIYLMPVGLVFLFCFLLFAGLRNVNKQFIAKSDGPVFFVMLIFFLLSLSFVYRTVFLIFQEVFNFNAIDRLPVRSIVYPLTLLFAIICGFFQRILLHRIKSLSALAYGLFMLNLLLVITHSELWLQAIQQPFSRVITDNSALLIPNQPFVLTESSDPRLLLLASFLCLSVFWLFHILRQICKVGQASLPIIQDSRI